MADKTYYVWSPIVGGNEKVSLGEEVTQESLGISDEDWRYLKEAGSVRTTPYPVPEGSTLSPTQHRLNELANQQSGAYTPDDVEEEMAPDGQESNQGRGW